jgi:hypothetical protein
MELLIDLENLKLLHLPKLQGSCNPYFITSEYNIIG